MSARNAHQTDLQAAAAILESVCSIPDDYEFLGMRKVVQDARLLCLLRYQRSDGRNNHRNGEHFSGLVNIEEGRVEGIISIDRKYTVDIDINDEDTRAASRDFLSIAAPDLIDRVEERWIKPMQRDPKEPPHDSPFEFRDHDLGLNALVIGRRFKMFDPNTKTWAWTIIASDGSLICFERDISWDGIRKRRMTEQWLYDDWVERSFQLS